MGRLSAPAGPPAGPLDPPFLRGLPRRLPGLAEGGSEQLERNTPSWVTSQAGSHPDPTVRQVLRSGPRSGSGGTPGFEHTA